MTQHALMTTDEVAEVFRCTPRTLWNWRRDGWVRAVKIGRSCLYPRDEIERLCVYPPPSVGPNIKVPEGASDNAV